MTDMERFLSKVNRTDTCWIWMASKKYQEYGQFWWNGKMEFAHRVSYQLFKGEIPRGLTIDHLCRNQACVNPEHLEAVTLKENILRSEGITAQKARQTHCIKGHEFNEANTRTDWRGNRSCKICVLESNRESFLKNKDKINQRRNELRRLNPKYGR